MFTKIIIGVLGICFIVSLILISSVFIKHLKTIIFCLKHDKKNWKIYIVSLLRVFAKSLIAIIIFALYLALLGAFGIFLIGTLRSYLVFVLILFFIVVVIAFVVGIVVYLSLRSHYNKH